MSFVSNRSALAAALLLATASPTIVQAQSTGLEDMVGARAGQAEAELQRRGYVNAGSQRGDDRSYSSWWNANRRQCVTIATLDGRYNSITPTTAPDCGKSANDRGRLAADRDGRNYDRYRSERFSGDAHRSRQHMPVRGVSDTSELQSICRIEGSGRYDRRPSELTLAGVVRQRDGAVVRGWFDVGKRTTFFTCQFDQSGRFVGLD